MPSKTIKARIKCRRDTSANWTQNNPVLLYGEIILVDTSTGELRAKIGDGVKTYTQLPFSDEVLRSLIDEKVSVATTTINNQITNLVGDTPVAEQISAAVEPKLDATDATWTQIFDSGEITSNVNAISNISIAGYKSLIVVIKCVNSNKTSSSRAGAIYLGDTSGQFYIFGNMFTDLLKKGTTVTGAMAKFQIVDGFIICEHAAQTAAGDDILASTNGSGVETLAPVNGGIIRCTNPLAGMAITSTGWSTSHYYGAGSRVVVWGCKV